MEVVVFRFFVIFAVSVLFASAREDAYESECNEEYDIVIVGAGMNGLSAYATLQELAPDKKVHILEATDRVGGRVKSFQFHGYTMEMGANWLTNPILYVQYCIHSHSKFVKLYLT